MWHNLYFNEAFDNATKKVLTSGLGAIDHGTGLIVPTNNYMAYESNWLFAGYTTSLRDCRLWHSIMFNCYGLVPSFCKLRCYKVVVKVRNFREMMQFYGLMNSHPCINCAASPLHGKVGKDERYYSSGFFNGFVYCDGLEDALDKYQIVRKLIDDHIEGGQDIPVIVKRSCTEFEKSCGPTDGKFWQEMSKDEVQLQRRIEDMYQPQLTSAVQPDWLKNKIIAGFVRWANTVGDKSWIGFYHDRDNITVKAVTYHHLIEGDKQNGTSKNSHDAGA